MYTPVAITWNALGLTGLAGLFLLLVTFLLVRSLPQRENPFFMNMLLCMFLSTIPCVLLLITGQLGEITIPSICFAQSAMMDGVAPMWGVAVVVLVFHVWRELKAIVEGRKSTLSQSFGLRVALLLAPYVTFLAWTVGSGAGALRSPGEVELGPFVFCSDRGSHFTARRLVGPFLVICCGAAITFEVMTVLLLCSRRRKQDAVQASVWSTYQHHSTVRIYLRTVVFTFFQIIPVILTILTRTNRTKARVQTIDDVVQLFEISYGLLGFFLFATQRTVLEAWRLLPREMPDWVGVDHLV